MPLDDQHTQRLIENERLKLLATFINGIGIAMFAVGGLAPVMTNFYGPNGVSVIVMATSTVCILGAFAVHYAGNRILGGLSA